VSDHSYHSRQAKERAHRLSGEIIGSAIKVHMATGPGLLESVYETCLAQELWSRGMRCERQVLLPITYNGTTIDGAYRVDLLVEDLVIVELKASEELLPVHFSQLLTYLRLSERWLGLLLNFNTPKLRDGVRRIVNR
jgi:GxxExxY protein